MARGHFDSQAFFAALDAVRLRKNTTWKQIASEAGVSASTLTRMAQGRRPDVDSLAALADWAGLDVGNFIVTERPPEQFGGQALEKVTALFRADPNLSHEAAQAIETTLKVLYEKLRTQANQ